VVGLVGGRLRRGLRRPRGGPEPRARAECAVRAGAV